MEFNQLENFISVVKHKSFSKAARELFLTQPSISNNIQNLEKELGAVLLDRKGKTIALTDSGKIFYRYALELINTREQAIHSIKDHLNKIEGKIELKASSIPEQYILPYIIKDFTKIYPKVTFSIIHKNSMDIIDDILIGKESFGIVGIKCEAKMLEYINFYQDELVLATPYEKEYPKTSSNILDINILFSENFIFRKEGSGTRLFIEERLSEKNISLEDLNIISIIDSNEMIKKMIELSLGVSFISKIAIKDQETLKIIKSYKIEGLDLTRDFYFVYNKNRTLSPLVETFKDFLLNWPGLDII